MTAENHIRVHFKQKLIQHAFGNCSAVERASAPAEFVDETQTAGCGIGDRMLDLLAFHQEGRLGFEQIIR